MAYIDIDLDDFDADDLIDALENKHLHPSHKTQLRELIGDNSPITKTYKYNEYDNVLAALQEQFSVKEIESMLRIPFYQDNERQLKITLSTP